MEKPNIVYVHSHDTGRYIQPHGYAMPSPNLQQLAEEGVLFRKAFCAAPTCSPSRASLLTGEYPHSNGQFGLVNRGFELPDADKHIVKLLRENGYFTALFGFQHVRKDPESIGYDQVRYLDDKAALLVPEVLEFLDNKPKQPFFLSIGFTETHRAFYEPSSEDNPGYCQPPAPLPDTPETRADMVAYKASLRVFDNGVGRVVEALTKNGLNENTLVICTTDHGIAFPGMKCTLTDHGIGVFLIMRGPGGFSGAKVSDALISQVDIFPTICDLLGIKPPSRLQGRSFLPVIRGDAKEVNEEIFAEINYHCQYEPVRAVRTRRWKYIRRFSDRKTPLLANIDSSCSKELWLRYGYERLVLPNEELYDLIFDPIETNNLSCEQAAQPVLAEMRQRLDRWMRQTNDPLLHGDIPLPSTGVVSHPDDQEPQDIWKYTEQPEGFI